MEGTKSQPITKEMVWAAYKRVKANRGSAGVDQVSLEEFEADLPNQLYKLWNRLTSGSYFPPAVLEVEIPKGGGKVRKLGIPTVADRIAQMVVKEHLEPKIDPIFSDSSYGYRPGKSAHKALAQTRVHCWQYDWVLDMDIKGFFDELDHELLIKALKRHCDDKWVLMYVGRWLKAPIKGKDGRERMRTRGTPQGGVISPLLANLYLHYCFDRWFEGRYSGLPFERYADDIIIHLKTASQAVEVLEQVKQRIKACRLELNEEKTCIVYCRDQRRKQKNEYADRFTFLGFEFKSRKTKGSNGVFYGFTPAISKKATKRLIGELRILCIHKWTHRTISDIAKELNPRIRGWLNYYGRYGKWVMKQVFFRLHLRLAKWARNKYKRLKRSWYLAFRAIRLWYEKYPSLFAHWQHGFYPS